MGKEVEGSIAMTPPTGAVLAELSPGQPPHRTASQGVARPSGTSRIGMLSEMHWAAEWRDETLRQIRNLRWLAAGWDGPGSPAMRETTLAIACELVGVLAERMPDLRPPAIVPTPDAGVFIEWHDLKRSVGFTVRDADDVELCYEDAVRGVEWEGHIGRQPNDDWRRILLTHQR